MGNSGYVLLKTVVYTPILLKVQVDRWPMQVTWPLGYQKHLVIKSMTT
jgi:hypothetical protein